jgi:hypothetical protein
MAEGQGTPAWESVAIVLAVLALLPQALAPHWRGSEPVMLAAGLLMVVVFVRKVARVRQLWKQQDKKD